MKKALCLLAWAFFLCLLFSLCFYFALWSGKGLLKAALLWLFFIVILCLFFLIRAALTIVNEKKLLGKLLPRHAFTRTEHLLFGQWKKGLHLIKRVYKKKQLPWLILTGSASGKSTLMTHAGMAQCLDNLENNVLPTRTVRWWHFRHAAFLELSSRFLIAGNPLATSWPRLVDWLRSAPTPAGIVVTVSAGELFSGEPQPERLAQLVRMQLAPLLKKLQRRLPVYVIVTGCDRLAGFSSWVKKLSTLQQQQALGRHWRQSPLPDEKDPGLLDSLFLPLKEGLDRARLGHLSGQVADESLPDLLAFPEEMMRLQQPVQRYVATLCATDSFSASGQLAGIWFTAALPDGPNRLRGYFMDELLTLVPELSQQREPVYSGYYRRYARWGDLAATALVLTLLLASAGSTLQLITGDSNSLTDDVNRLLRIETSADRFRYLPFRMVLSHHQQRLAEKLVAAAAVRPIDINEATEQYTSLFDKASAEQQRKLIIALAEAIASKQAMRNNAPLASLAPVLPSLTMFASSGPLSPTHSLIVQRALLNGPQGAAQLQHLRQLLQLLVNRDPQWQWLLAPVDELPAIRLADFLPATTNAIVIESSWTVQGRQQLQAWLEQIRMAAGERLPALDKFEQHYNALRQAAWQKFMVELSRQAIPFYSAGQWTDILLAIGDEKGPALRFVTLAEQQLSDISAQEAAPWLRQLRRLSKVQTTAKLQKWLRQKSLLESELRQKIAGPQASPGISIAQVEAWHAWRKSAQLAVSAALGAPANTLLTAGLFQSATDKAENPLRALRLPQNSLRKELLIADPATDRFWLLYALEERLLVVHAMQQTGCWLQQQWEKTVLWPLDKLKSRLSYDELQDRSRLYLSAFMRGPAKEVLVADSRGVTSGTYAEQQVPLTPSFLLLVNEMLRPDDLLALPERQSLQLDARLSRLREQQQVLKEEKATLEARSAELTLQSLPATIPGGARLMPTGTTLTLFCGDRQWSLDSMNFSDRATFLWRPGHCQRVTQTIKFPGFQLAYHYKGDGAWPEFLNAIADGQHSYSADDFPEQADFLQAQNIHTVLVRYQAGPLDEVLDLWQQWQETAQALRDNVTDRYELAQETFDDENQKEDLSALPVTIAACHQHSFSSVRQETP